MISLFKTENDLRRLEKSSRLLSYRFQGQIFAVAADDLGDHFRYLTIKQVAERGYASPEAAWSDVQNSFSKQSESLSTFGMAPFWFVDCPNCPPSAFLAWAGLETWGQATLGSQRPLIAASFSPTQLIIGFADSAEFHDRLGHARQAPVESGLFLVPFLLNSEAPPTAIEKINLEVGDCVILLPEDKACDPICLPLV